MKKLESWKVYVDPRKGNVHVGRSNRMDTLKVLFPFPFHYEFVSRNMLESFLSEYKQKRFFIIWH